MKTEPYIVFRRVKAQGINGPVNLHYGGQVERKSVLTCTDPERREDFLVHGGTLICAADSRLSHTHFAPNGDGQGLERGRLCAAIQAKLERRDQQYQARWDRVWQDPLCKRFQRQDHPDHWLWNADFFRAKVGDLRRIARLVGA